MYLLYFFPFNFSFVHVFAPQLDGKINNVKGHIFYCFESYMHLPKCLSFSRNLPSIDYCFLYCRTSRCDWCCGPKFGEGFRVIRSFDIFGVTHLPVMFHVCSSSCYRKAKESNLALDGTSGKRTRLNSE